MQFNDLFSVVEDITINDIENWEFNDWKEKGKLLNESNLDCLSKFISLEYSGDNPPYYHCIPSFNSSISCNDHKFIIIKNNNDEILIMYKVVQIMHTKIIKIYDKPISINRNCLVEQEIVNKLSKKNFFKFTYKDKYATLYGGGELSEQDCDNFYSRDEMIAKYTNKYIKKHLFYRYNEPDFKIELTTKCNVDELIELRKSWEETKIENGMNVYTKLNVFKKVINYIDDNKDYLQLNIYYKNKLISNYIYYKFKNSLINLYRTTLSLFAQNNEDDTWLKNTLSRIDAFSVYYTFNNCKNVDYIYYGGANPSNKNLMDYKNKHSSGKVIYYSMNSIR